MVHLIPFQATHYNPEKINNLGKTIAPPYDQISEAAQETLYQRSPYNFVRLIYGKIFPDDTEQNNRYHRAAHDLQNWIQEGILIQEKAPSFFVYEQRFSLKDGSSYSRLGLVGLLGLEPLGAGVLPHEQTFSKPKEDRLKLMRACKANLEHVFFLYDDPESIMKKLLENAKQTSPLLNCEDEYGTTHKSWQIPNEFNEAIQTFFQPKRLLIADGHHRYETSLAYQAETGFGFRLGAFVSLQDPGLVILPTHRVLKKISTQDKKRLEQKLPEYFDIQKVGGLDELLLKMQGQKHTIGLADKNQFQWLILKKSFRLASEFPDIPNVLRDLDVFLLHQLVFTGLLNLDSASFDQQISYVRWPEDAAAMLQADSHDMAFFLNPVTPEEVNTVAQTGLKMPHKSTDFYPKLWSGLLLARCHN